MRLWHYKLIPVLPKDMLISQWRELIAIKRQWEKDTLKHRLVSYVKDYDKKLYFNYVIRVREEMAIRGINHNLKYLDEIFEFCNEPDISAECYPEHNDRYLSQCYHNLQEKYDRGIISQDEWIKIVNCTHQLFVGDINE